MASIAIARAIEVAEHNGCYEDEGRILVVFDALQQDRYYGIRLEVERTTGVLGWRALARDGVGKAYSVWVPESYTRENAVEQALEGYLSIVNHGL
jgi:hypothetical protein